MKLVVDIDEEDYRMIQDRIINDESWGFNLSDIDIAISEGKPLDAVLGEIREEMVELQKEYQEYGWAYDDALEIIDKYKGREG